MTVGRTCPAYTDLLTITFRNVSTEGLSSRRLALRQTRGSTRRHVEPNQPHAARHVHASPPFPFAPPCSPRCPPPNHRRTSPSSPTRWIFSPPELLRHQDRRVDRISWTHVTPPRHAPRSAPQPHDHPVPPAPPTLCPPKPAGGRQRPSTFIIYLLRARQPCRAELCRVCCCSQSPGRRTCPENVCVQSAQAFTLPFVINKCPV